MILTSCQLCSYNVSYNTSLLLEQVWRGYNQAPEKYSAVNIEIGISRNTKCAIWNGFPKSSHIIYSLPYMYFRYSRKIIWLDVLTTNNNPNVVLHLYLLTVLENSGMSCFLH